VWYKVDIGLNRLIAASTPFVNSMALSILYRNSLMFFGRCEYRTIPLVRFACRKSSIPLALNGAFPHPKNKKEM
jgi:hypothetical protein